MSGSSPRETKSAHGLAFEHYLRTGQKLTTDEWKARFEQKFNPYHDPSNGRFTFAPGSDAQDGPDIVVYGRKPKESDSSSKWKAKDKSVRVPETIRPKVDAVANDYHAATNKTLTVTDAARTPQDQAQRMYYKYSHGDFSTYPGPQGRQMADIYRQGRADGNSASQIQSDMASAIEKHLDDGRAVSKHLYNRAVDFSVRDMTASDKAALRDAIRQNGGTPLQEGVPPHIHASF